MMYSLLAVFSEVFSSHQFVETVCDNYAPYEKCEADLKNVFLRSRFERTRFSLLVADTPILNHPT